MDVGLPPGPATLVALLDGTTSLYLGNGGGTIGAGEVAAVAQAARRLLLTVEATLAHLPYAWRFPIPGSGRMQLVALTYSGARAAEVELAQLESPSVSGADPGARYSPGHPLGAGYHAAGAVLEEIGRLEEARVTGTRHPGPLV